MSLKNMLRPLIPAPIRAARIAWKSVQPIHPRQCPICGYQGNFGMFGRPPRIDALCKGCGSLERHRLFWLWFDAKSEKMQEPILHFAPEPFMEKMFRNLYGDYRSADLFAKADLKLNIEDTGLATGSFRTIICHHVLEHVNDRKAMAELYRLLADDGLLICSVPMVEAWESTFDDPDITSPEARKRHYGYGDHVRMYGRDFRDRLSEAGFAEIEAVTAKGKAVADHGLMAGETFFLCRKG